MGRRSSTQVIQFPLYFSEPIDDLFRRRRCRKPYTSSQRLAPCIPPEAQLVRPAKLTSPYHPLAQIEFWPTTVIIAKGGRLQVEVAGNDDPEVSERYGHDDAIDR